MMVRNVYFKLIKKLDYLVDVIQLKSLYGIADKDTIKNRIKSKDYKIDINNTKLESLETNDIEYHYCRT